MKSITIKKTDLIFETLTGAIKQDYNLSAAIEKNTVWKEKETVECPVLRVVTLDDEMYFQILFCEEEYWVLTCFNYSIPHQNLLD
jgi:isocitrate dehydrogenase